MLRSEYQAGGELSPGLPPRPRRGHAHAVHFYEDDGALCARVAEHLAGGVEAGEPAILIATGPHAREVLERLGARGVDVPGARVAGRIVVLDADATLAAITEGGRVDGGRFHATVGGVVEHALRAAHAGSLRAYGEMVDLLWSRGEEEAALELEALWDELGARFPMRLLCGYGLERFAQAADAPAFDRVCGAHDTVLDDRSLEPGEEERRRELARLRQRERALATELRHREALEARLRAALSGAEAASRAKNEFLAVMSHELRTPLNAIAGYVALMEMGIRGPITPQQREDLRRIRESQRHLLSLIDEVLDHARLEAGALDYRPAAVAAAGALLAAEEAVAPQAREKGVSLLVEPVPGDGLAVLADPEKLRRILGNLLSNAVKFTPPGGEVTVRCEARGGEALFRVTDTGIGIAADKLERIFEPFVQADSELTRVHQGTGLGLAICRALARGMGGEVSVESTPGAGSTFTLALPRA